MTFVKSSKNFAQKNVEFALLKTMLTIEKLV